MTELNQLNNNLPKFSQIKIENIESELSQLLQNNRQRINELLQQPQAFTWQNLMQPLEDLDDRLHNYWSSISHLNAVKNSKALRAAYNACLPKITDYHTELSHNQKFYQAIQSIADNNEYQQLNPAQRKVIDNAIRDFKLAGVALSAAEKKQFATLCKQLSKLTTQFEENVLDATHDWTKFIDDKKQLSGLPAHAIQAAAETARADDKNGWLFTLDFPSYFAVITYADSTSLRQEMHYAFTTRASDQGPQAGKWDNSAVMEKILAVRLELAKLLEFNNYAERSLATKMVKHPQDVLDFLTKLAKASLPIARDEFQTLCDFAQQKLGMKQLNAWDIAYVSEKLRQDRYDISQEDLRPYFPENQVINGLFKIVKQLFNINIQEIKKFDAWHPDVRFFEITDKNGTLCSQFYFDLYARENKRGGAWMDDCRVRRQLENNKLQIPVAYVTCNFSPPIGKDPAIFTHDEVVTLFHEFGHALQHMLTKIDYADVSGINGIPWDAVEIASQFLENWAWEQQSIAMISQHYQTKAPLPDTLFNKMHAAKNFQSALQMVRQLELSLFDFQLHLLTTPPQTPQIQQVLDAVRKEVSVIPVPPFNRFQHGFSHIFAGGYAAGYYSYKWAEVMASDAFSLFAEKGIFNPETSHKFLITFLESGGVKEPLQLFKEFRGREPRIEALLKQSGIIDKEFTYDIY